MPEGTYLFCGPHDHGKSSRHWVLGNLNFPTQVRPIPFPSYRFHVLLTLFSKFFSTFPHGTCPLSDSCQYLALDGVYHPLWAAFSNNPTPGRPDAPLDIYARKALHLPWEPQSEGLSQIQKCQNGLPYATFLAPQLTEIRRWAIPASLAVTRGILVSFFSSAY